MPNKSHLMTEKFKQQRIRKRKICTLVAALAVAVTSGTIWALVQPASAMTGDVICGMEEHTHTDECYENRLVCGLEESEEHLHTENCWQKELTCTKPEHVHETACYSSVSSPASIVGSSQSITEDSESKSAAAESIDESESSSDYMNSSSSETNPESAEISSESASQSEQSEENIQEEHPSDVPSLDQLPKDIPAEYTEIYEAQVRSGNSSIRVYAQPGTFPEGTELKTVLYTEDSDEFVQAVQRLADAGIIYDSVTALDIALYNPEGEKVEPSAPVYVSIDASTLLTEESDPRTIQIQHHKEIVPQRSQEELNTEVYNTEEPEVQIEPVVDDDNGLLEHNEDTGVCIATFPVDSFSIYTITSKGWPALKIKVQCVDERGNELRADHKPDDVAWPGNYTHDSEFSIIFMSNECPQISGYRYDNKAYFMRNGDYESRIFGLRRESNKWYYFPKEDKNKLAEFTKQPNFEMSEGKDPPDFIRLVYRKVTDIHVQYMDDAGSFSHQEIPLSQEDAPNHTNPDVINYVGTELDISDVDAMPKSSTYFFVGRAYVGLPTRDNEVFKIIREDGIPYGVTEENQKLPISEDSPLKLMYHKTQTEIPALMKTVSTRDKGLTINLFDYNTDKSPSVNDGHNLQFVPSPTGSKDKEYNNWTGTDGGIYTNIVGDTLQNGYPTVEGESLNYLFDPELCNQQLGSSMKHVHTDLDHLFWMDQDGYYRYDSMTNFATIMAEDSEHDGHRPGHTTGGDFIVYKQPALPGGERGAKFLPFNKYSEANVPKKGDSDEGREYHFGMTMEADFVMPPGGVIPDADGAHTGLRDMIFEFNGDDDVWVFIDGKLALDLGGIHGRYGGTINFRTGEVTTNAPPAPHSGWHQKNLYGITVDPSTLSPEDLKRAREEAGFGKFSQHNFKFFYLERGKEASNCEIRFNLVPVEHGLVVGKRLPESVSEAATEHMWYQFQVEAEHGNERHPLQNATYRRIRWEPDADPVIGGQSIGVGKTDENGRFWIRAGERADFSGAIDLKHAGTTEDDKIKIYVSEIFPSGTIVPKVIAWAGESETEGTHMVVDNNGKPRKIVPPLYDDKAEFHTKKTEISATEERLPETGETICQTVVTTGRHNEFNWIDFENDLGAVSGLNITKHARHTDGSTPITDVSFAIKVELWDNKTKEWVPLPNGSDYWILNPQEEPKPETKRKLTESDGGLIYIKDSQTIHLHMLPGTEYRVSEALTLEESAVYETTYEGKTSISGEKLETLLNEDKKQVGIVNTSGIAAGSQHYISITNTGDPISMPDGSFVLTKQAVGVIPPNSKFQFSLSIQNEVPDSPTGEIQCTATYYGYPEKVYPENPKHGHAETICFTQVNAGSYEANLELYPDEIVVITGLPEDASLKVREIFAEDETGHYDVSFREEGKEPVAGTEIGGSASPLTPVGAGRVVKVNCTNRSNLKEHSEIQLTKTVKRTDQPDGTPLPEDLERDFEFSITLQNPSSFAEDQASAKITAVNGVVTYLPLKFEPQGKDYVAKIKVKHGEKLAVMGLPVNVQAVIQEIGHKGYAVSMNNTPGDQITVNLKPTSGQAYSVTCVNMTGVEIPETGGHGRLPYYLLGISLMIGAAVWLFQRQKGKKSSV